MRIFFSCALREWPLIPFILHLFFPLSKVDFPYLFFLHWLQKNRFAVRTRAPKTIWTSSSHGSDSIQNIALTLRIICASLHLCLKSISVHYAGCVLLFPTYFWGILIWRTHLRHSFNSWNILFTYVFNTYVIPTIARGFFPLHLKINYIWVRVKAEEIFVQLVCCGFCLFPPTK